MWDEIAYPFENFNGTTIEIWEWISNLFHFFNGYMITYPCWASEWLSLTAFLGTVDIGVHIVHLSGVIVAYTLESLFSLT